MKANSLFLLFLFSSLLLIVLCLFLYATPLYEHRLEVIRLSKIQKVCMKAYSRKRDKHIYIYSFNQAQQRIKTLLLKNPIEFLPDSASIDINHSVQREANQTKVTLAHIVKILETIDEKVALTIAVYTDKEGTKQHNLKLSQERADKLKNYINKKIKISFISSIGYGEAFPLRPDNNGTNRRVEIELKRIQL